MHVVHGMSLIYEACGKCVRLPLDVLAHSGMVCGAWNAEMGSGISIHVLCLGVIISMCFASILCELDLDNADF